MLDEMDDSHPAHTWTIERGEQWIGLLLLVGVAKILRVRVRGSVEGI